MDGAGLTVGCGRGHHGGQRPNLLKVTSQALYLQYHQGLLGEAVKDRLPACILVAQEWQMRLRNITRSVDCQKRFYRD